MHLIIHHWQYMDGWRNVPPILQKPGKPVKEFDEDIKGWHCWVYPHKDIDFPKWMEENMTGEYECSFKFNSGDPMFLTFIKSDEDATLFKLTWNPTADRFGGAGAW